MKFYMNEIPDDISFNPENEWKTIKEPTNLWLVQLLAIPFAILNILIVILAATIIGIQLEFKSMLLLAGFILIVPIHELLHADRSIWQTDTRCVYRCSNKILY